MIETSLKTYRRDRALVIGGIVLLSALSWGYLFAMAAPMEPGDHVMAAPAADWDASLLVPGMLMWSIMMIAMMLPSATPMVLGFQRVQRQRQAGGKTRVPSWIFIAGYLLAWTAFSMVAGFAQWSLHGLKLLSSSMGSASPEIAAGLLLAAGIFQVSGVKEACLSKCRSPLSFLLNEWRDGRGGAMLMGLHHGAICVACCWMLMLLMFVGGVMNLLWMALIAIYVLAEKVLPRTRRFSQVTAALLIAAGVLTLGLALTG